MRALFDPKDIGIGYTSTLNLYKLDSYPIYSLFLTGLNKACNLHTNYVSVTFAHYSLYKFPHAPPKDLTINSTVLPLTASLYYTSSITNYCASTFPWNEDIFNDPQGIKGRDKQFYKTQMQPKVGAHFLRQEPPFYRCKWLGC